MSVLACTMMYLFAAQQVTDSATPAIAGHVQKVFARSLEESAPATLTMRRLSTGTRAPRHYVLHLTPSPPVAADGAAVERIMERAAELVHGELERVKAPITVTCVAHLPEGRERRLSYDQRMQSVDEPVKETARSSE